MYLFTPYYTLYMYLDQINPCRSELLWFSNSETGRQRSYPDILSYTYFLIYTIHLNFFLLYRKERDLTAQFTPRKLFISLIKDHQIEKVKRRTRLTWISFDKFVIHSKKQECLLSEQSENTENRYWASDS